MASTEVDMTIIHNAQKTTVAVTALICAFTLLTGCTPPEEVDPDTPAILPEDTICRVLPADRIAEFLSPTEHVYDPDTLKKDESYILYLDSINAATGVCALHERETSNISLLVIAFQNDKPRDQLISDCNGPKLDLKPPAIGEIDSSASCNHYESRPTSAEAWVVYRGGQNNNHGKPVLTTFTVHINTRPGRDGVADATQVMQMILDYMVASHQEYVAGIQSQAPPDATAS